SSSRSGVIGTWAKEPARTRLRNAHRGHRIHHAKSNRQGVNISSEMRIAWKAGMSPYDSRTKLEPLRDHFDTFGRAQIICWSPTARDSWAACPHLRNTRWCAAAPSSSESLGAPVRSGAFVQLVVLGTLDDDQDQRHTGHYCARE